MGRLTASQRCNCAIKINHSPGPRPSGGTWGSRTTRRLHTRPEKEKLGRMRRPIRSSTAARVVLLGVLAPRLRRDWSARRAQPPLERGRQVEGEVPGNHPADRDDRRVALPVRRVAVPAGEQRTRPAWESRGAEGKGRSLWESRGAGIAWRDRPFPSKRQVGRWGTQLGAQGLLGEPNRGGGCDMARCGARTSHQRATTPTWGTPSWDRHPLWRHDLCTAGRASAKSLI